MSWDISLQDENGNIPDVELFCEGGTQPVGGSTKAELNVTYNYSDVIHVANIPTDLPLEWTGGRGRFYINALDGQKAKYTIATLEAAVNILGVNKYTDYWAPTPGNAGYALNILLGWAKQYPDHVWVVE